ncbi:GNAT family N-acetyltransferase [Citrifermentans bremense]|uniref:GNAT family N-acetyltransferase n=1 Tax=Citrifermentans bremense TaxID=60035 RepID=UPI001CF795EE|nr:GNAT family N-acetyltransferase [Citrifermentans bremense]
MSLVTMEIKVREKLREMGYVISHNIHRDRFLKNLDVCVRFRGAVVAEACFTDDGDSAYCHHVKVEPEYRRRGIASAMYQYAESIFLKKLENHWHDDPETQSPEARAFWAQPHRPFGFLSK